MAKIEPTVGRVVWYRPKGSDPAEQPLSAQIAHVNPNGTINIGYLSLIGVPGAFVGVPIWDGDGERPTDAHCEWMPYQKGQAAKAEALERQVADQGMTAALRLDDGTRA